MNKKKRTYRIVKRIAKVLAVLLILCGLLLLFIRSPWGQGIIKDRLVSFIVEKTGATLTIEKLFVTFSGNLEIQELFLKDLQKDTLLYSEKLNANIAFGPLLFNNTLKIKELEWTGVVANISRDADTERYNFTFLLEALTPQEPEPSEETTESTSFSVENLFLNDFQIRYSDAFLGITSTAALGGLRTGLEKLDLEALRFYFKETVLSNSDVSYLQSQPFNDAEQDSKSALPQIKFEEIRLNKVKAAYHSVPDSIDTKAIIDELSLEIPNIDLNSNRFEFNEVALRNSTIALELLGRQMADSQGKDDTEALFKWPDIRIRADNVDLSDNEFDYQSAIGDSTQTGFDPNHLHLKGIGLNAYLFQYEPGQVQVDINQVAFQEKSGLVLQAFSMEGSMYNNTLELGDFKIKTEKSSAEGSAKFKYASVNQLFNAPEVVNVDINVPYFKIGLNDLLIFQPNLASSATFVTATQNPLLGQLTAKGTLNEMVIKNTKVEWGERTALEVEGTLYQPTRVDSFHFNMDRFKAVSGRKDLERFPDFQKNSLVVPEKIMLSGTASGSLNETVADLQMESTLGSIAFQGRGGYSDTAFVDGTLRTDSLQLGSLLANEQLGLLEGTAQVSLSGVSAQELNGRFKLMLSKLEWNQYQFSNLEAEGTFDKGQGVVQINYKDKNLHFDSQTKVELDSTYYDVATKLNLKGADLNALGLLGQNIKMGAQLNAGFRGTATDYTIKTHLSNIVAVRGNEQFQTADILADIEVGSSSSRAGIESSFLNGRLQTTGSPTQVGNAMTRRFEAYFSDSVSTANTKDTISASMEVRLTPEPILTEVFLEGLDRLDTVSMNASFSAISKKLHAELHVPYAEYQGAVLDSIHLLVDGDAQDLSFSSGLASLRYEPVNIQKTYFEGTLQNKQLLLDFLSYDGNEKLVHLASEMQWKQDTLQLHINPEALILNKNPWSIPDGNHLFFSKNNLHFEQMLFTRNEQLLELTNAINGIESDHIGVIFDNFRLQTFLSLFNSEEALGSGKVGGQLILENPFKATGLVADLQITDFGIYDNRLGNLDLQARSKGLSGYALDLAIKEGAVDLDVSGNYQADPKGARLDLFLNLKKLETAMITGFFKDELAQPKGFLSGKFDIGGTVNEPLYEGSLSFNNTALEVVSLDTTFEITDETVVLDETSIRFGEFTIKDAKGNFFTVDGNIGTETVANPIFDLNFKADEFRLLDSTKEDNELYYGIASIDADVNLKGPLKLPKLDGRLRVRKVTELTYVVPEEQLDIQERDGVVIFVNRENPDAILTQSEPSSPDLFRGLDVSLVVEVAEDALFSIILDEKTGDVLQIAGDAALNLNVNPNGSIGLTGKYELSDGYYRTSLYNLVSRRFDINPGSTITWRGDPMDADLDVTAIYRVETSAAPLMATATSGVEASLAAKYQQVMPFLVYLNVDGELTAPKLSFDLGIPENAKGDLGGAVYGKVQQLNEQETELNKQVFSLLALNRFFPNTGSDGSSGGAAGLARNNINKVLSGELNSFSDKVLGDSGFDLNFDLDSFTDYSGESAQDRTQLNVSAQKRLFDDRLIVTAGSAIDVEGSAQTGQEETPIIGNVSLEYLLTQNGRYRLKGFRKNEYVNVIDGQLIVTGLALIFNREFNSFSELFNPLKNSSPTPEEKTNQPSKGQAEDD